MEIKAKGNRFIEFLAYLGISFIISMLSLFFFPKVFEGYLDGYSGIDVFSVVTLIISAVSGCALVALLFKALGKYTTKKAITRTIMMLGVFITALCIISILSGFTAEYIYAKYSNVKTLEEIKELIDLISKALSIIVMPLGITLFWRLARNDLRKGAKNYLPSTSQYIKLVILILGFMIVGLTAQLAFPERDSRIVSVFLLTTIGVVSFYISKRICCARKLEGNEEQ